MGDSQVDNYEAKFVWDSFQRLSQGDKSCLAQMLATPGGQQMTTDKSAHGEFYHVLHSFGMAEPCSIDEKMGALGLKTWALTAHGREALRVYLAQGYAKADIAAGEGKVVRITALRFLLGYAPVQVVGGLLAYFLTRLGYDISTTAIFNSLILLILSCSTGLWAALRARHPQNGLDLLHRLEELKYIKQRRSRYSSAIMIAAFGFQLPVAIAHGMMLGALTPMALVGAFVYAVFVGIWVYFVGLETEVERVFRKTCKDAGGTGRANKEEEVGPIPQ